MKKTFITAAMLAAATWFAPNVNAQGGSRSIPVSFKIPVDPRSNVVTPDASELAKKTQVELYRGADGQVWETANNKQSVCSFTLNNIRHIATYDKKGNWRWTEKSYRGADLSWDLRTLIFQNFGEVNIQWVDEISMPNDLTNYFVVISNSKVTRRVRVVDEKIDIIEEFATK